MSKWKLSLALVVALYPMPASAAAEDDLIGAAGAGDIPKIVSLLAELAEKVNVNARTKDVGMTALVSKSSRSAACEIFSTLSRSKFSPLWAESATTKLRSMTHSGTLEGIQDAVFDETEVEGGASPLKACDGSMRDVQIQR